MKPDAQRSNDKRSKVISMPGEAQATTTWHSEHSEDGVLRQRRKICKHTACPTNRTATSH